MLGRLLKPADEQRAITYQSLFLSDQLFDRGALSGVVMNQTAAMKIGVVYAAVRLIADTIATLPVDVYFRQDGERLPFRPKPAWVDQPEADPTVGRSDFYQTIIMSVLLAGNSYTRVLRDESGNVIAMRNLDPHKVEPRMNDLGFVEFVYDNRRVIPGEDIIHITDIRRPGSVKGESRVDQLKDVLGISRALDEWSARYFGQGTVTSGIINYPGDMTAEQAERLKAQFENNSRGMKNAHRPNVLTGGAKYERITDDAQQAQLVEAKKFAVEEVARVFKIQPSMLGSQVPGARAYASQEQDSVSFVTITLRPIIYKIEEAFGRLLRPINPGAFLRFNMEGLLRGDIQSRYAAYSQGVQAGFLSINDIHRIEDMRPVEGGDVYRVPLSHVDLNAANIVEQDKRINMAVRLINVGFDPAEVLDRLQLPSMEHTGLPSVQLQNVAQVSDVEGEYEQGNGQPNANGTATTPSGNGSAQGASRGRSLSIAETVQKVYLGVGKVITSDEAREIVNAAGADLAVPGPEFVSPNTEQAERSLPMPIVNVNVPEQAARSKRVERDEDGNITAIVEE